MHIWSFWSLMQKLDEQDAQVWLIIDRSTSFCMYTLQLDVEVEFTWIRIRK